jgi:hypothetical protein
VLRPTDKQACGRAFGGIRSLLFEYLPGYTGVDVADRGADPESDAVLTIDEMEHLIATWIVAVWQNRRLGEHAPCWDPAGDHSPNTLFAAAMGQGGFAMQVPRPELFYQLLPAQFVKIHGQRGVKIRGLWYDGPALGPYRDRPSSRGGRHRGRWVIHRDPRDARIVFFQDPATHDWHPLRWSGLPPEGEVPSFSDARVRDLLRAARQAGLRPRSDTELLPLLLRLLGAHIPVGSWPARMTRSERTEHARESTQASAASADRPPGAGSTEPSRQADVMPLRWLGRASDAGHAVDAERRRRREAAVPARPEPAPLMRDALRDRSMLRIPDEQQGTHPGGDEEQA